MVTIQTLMNAQRRELCDNRRSLAVLRARGAPAVLTGHLRHKDRQIRQSIAILRRHG